MISVRLREPWTTGEFRWFSPEEIEYEVGFDDQHPISEGWSFSSLGILPKKGWDCQVLDRPVKLVEKGRGFAGLSEAIQSKMAVKSSTAIGR